ncbi:MAG: hypothetical protein M3Q29_13905, partial [Chloroflexota bacterium]|nr:hypothetical protein [Chloroflexota bacterium]
LDKARKLIPFPILGLDTDNGREFINEMLVEYCERNGITFTRGRVGRKNDQCFVEQKNGSVVRQIVGYDRFEGEGVSAAIGAVPGCAAVWELLPALGEAA